MIDFVSMAPAAIEEQDIATARQLYPETAIKRLRLEDWPEWALSSLQTIANHRWFYTNLKEARFAPIQPKPDSK